MTELKKVPLCVHCKSYLLRDKQHYCLHEKVNHLHGESRITGLFVYPLCEAIRADLNLCGHEAIWFEPRPTT